MIDLVGTEVCESYERGPGDRQGGPPRRRRASGLGEPRLAFGVGGVTAENLYRAKRRNRKGEVITRGVSESVSLL
jgi:hypothetical protein